jgi:acetolactate synthase-1/2/3 large subunit
VKKLRPDEKVLVVSGDGAFGLNGLELDSAVRQRLPFVTVVGNDAQWGQIRNPQLQFFGAQRAPATALAPTRYDHIAIAVGGHGELVEAPDEIGPAIRRAFESNLPAVVNVSLDPEALRNMSGRSYVM